MTVFFRKYENSINEKKNKTKLKKLIMDQSLCIKRFVIFFCFVFFATTTKYLNWMIVKKWIEAEICVCVCVIHLFLHSFNNNNNKQNFGFFSQRLTWEKLWMKIFFFAFSFIFGYMVHWIHLFFLPSFIAKKKMKMKRKFT